MCKTRQQREQCMFTTSNRFCFTNRRPLFLSSAGIIHLHAPAAKRRHRSRFTISRPSTHTHIHTSKPPTEMSACRPGGLHHALQVTAHDDAADDHDDDDDTSSSNGQRAPRGAGSVLGCDVDGADAGDYIPAGEPLAGGRSPTASSITTRCVPPCTTRRRQARRLDRSTREIVRRRPSVEHVQHVRRTHGEATRNTDVWNSVAAGSALTARKSAMPARKVDLMKRTCRTVGLDDHEIRGPAASRTVPDPGETLNSESCNLDTAGRSKTEHASSRTVRYGDSNYGTEWRRDRKSPDDHFPSERTAQ